MKYDTEYEYDWHPSDDEEFAICKECGEECVIIVVDEGIGSYEFWGANGTHHDYREVSSCCESDFERL